jgi:hypothetical protein
MRIRSLTVKNFIYKDTKCPNISRWAVNIVLYTLWRHVNGWPYANIWKLFSFFITKIILWFVMNSKSKICYFGFFVMDEYISDFYVPMNDVHLWEIQKPFKNTLNYRDSLLFLHSSKVINPWLQISLKTKFHNYVNIVLILQNLIALDNILMIDKSEYFNFRIDQFL